jgi:hypothetical protein
MLRIFLAFALIVPVSIRAAAAAVPSGFQETTVVSGLTLATGLTFLPDGRMIVLSKLGDIYLVAGGTSAVIHTVPAVLASQEAGLVGVAVDPGWPARPFVYVYYNRDPLEEVVLERLRASGDLNTPSSLSMTLSDPLEVLAIPESNWNHNGGTLRFGPDGMLYCSLGEDFQFCVAQDSTTLGGVILRLDVTALPDTGGGSIDRQTLVPADNPYAADTTDAALVYCHGLRNPYRFTIDPMEGALFIGDVGANDYEEINLAVGGENFCWPIWEADSLFGVKYGIDCGPLPSATFPIHSYFHVPHESGTPKSYAIVVGPSYRSVGAPGDYPASYDGVVFFTDFYEGWIRALASGPGGWDLLPPVDGQPDSANWATGLGNISDLIVGPDGALYYTGFNPGRVGRIQYFGLTGVPEDGGPPTPTAHLSVRPSPFRIGSGSLRIELPPGVRSGRLHLFDTSGRRVRSLTPGANGVARWDGADRSGRPVPSGVYFVRMGNRDVAVARVVVIG